MRLAILVSLAALAAAASTTRLLKSIEAGVSVDDLQEIIADTDINEADERGVTLLWASAFYGRVDAVELLLAAGADAEAATVDGQTAIFAAAHRGHAEDRESYAPPKGARSEYASASLSIRCVRASETTRRRARSSDDAPT